MGSKYLVRLYGDESALIETEIGNKVACVNYPCRIVELEFGNAKMIIEENGEDGFETLSFHFPRRLRKLRRWAERRGFAARGQGIFFERLGITMIFYRDTELRSLIDVLENKWSELEPIVGMTASILDQINRHTDGARWQAEVGTISLARVPQ